MQEEHAADSRFTRRRLVVDEERLHYSLALDEGYPASGLAPLAEAAGFRKQSHPHITILGGDSKKIVKSALATRSPEERQLALQFMRRQCESLAWDFDLADVCRIQKTGTFGGAATTETRQAYIQLLTMPDLETFYEHLREQLNVDVPTQFPHITIFTKGEAKNPKYYGIPVSSTADFLQMKQERVPQYGFFPGTFDPIHAGHLRSAQHAAQSLDKVWILPNPVPSKSKPNTTSLEIRRRLVTRAIEGEDKLAMPDGEAWSVYERAYRQRGVDEALGALAQHLGAEPTHLVGQDVFEKRSHADRKTMVIPRGGGVVTAGPGCRVLPAVGDISSSDIRRDIAKGAGAEALLHPAVLHEIKEGGLYGEMDEPLRVKQWVLAQIAGWQKHFDSENVAIELGGSLVSGLFVREGASKYDADVKFITPNPQDPRLLQKMQDVTGLQFRKTLRIQELPPEKNTASLIEKTFQLPGVSLPVDVEGCVRQGPYFNSHLHYKERFSAEELAEIKRRKQALRNDKAQYRAFKYATREELLRRVEADHPVSQEPTDVVKDAFSVPTNLEQDRLRAVTAHSFVAVEPAMK